MFARITWTQAPLGEQAQIDKATGFFRERVIPSMQTRAGFLGAAALVNTESGEGASVTYWESAEAMAGSEAMGAAGRAEAMQAMGGVITDVDRFEMLLQDRAGSAQVGSFVRVNDVPASPARIDDVLTWARDTGLPRVKAAAGYRALLILANRQTGRMLVSSIWDTAADRQASESSVSGLRGQMGAVAQAQGDIRISQYETIVSEVSQAAQQVGRSATAPR